MGRFDRGLGPGFLQASGDTTTEGVRWCFSFGVGYGGFFGG